MTTEWRKYEGMDEQIAEMMRAEDGYLLKLLSRKDVDINFDSDYILYSHEITHYLICNPHPLADMIARQCQTGQPVWIKEYFKFSVEPSDYKVNMTTTPDWNIPGAEYRFTPFED